MPVPTPEPVRVPVRVLRGGHAPDRRQGPLPQLMGHRRRVRPRARVRHRRSPRSASRIRRNCRRPVTSCTPHSCTPGFRSLSWVSDEKRRAQRRRSPDRSRPQPGAGRAHHLERSLSPMVARLCPHRRAPAALRSGDGPGDLVARRTRSDLDAVLLPLVQVHSSAPLLHRALDVNSRWRFAFHDSLIVAATLTAGCRTLLSEDLQHGLRIDGLKTVDPFRRARRGGDARGLRSARAPRATVKSAQGPYALRAHAVTTLLPMPRSSWVRLAPVSHRRLDLAGRLRRHPQQRQVRRTAAACFATAAQHQGAAEGVRGRTSSSART